MLYVFAVINVSTAAVHANLVESPARAKQATGKSKTRRAGGVRRPPAARRRDLPGRSVPAGGADHRQRPLASRWADRRRGVLHPDDARKAVDHGVSGVIVSNHGGRPLDGAIAALDALPPIVDAVGSQTTVLFDCGIRRGADVIKAMALGARCVLLGRPYCFGLAVNGEQGVRDVIENLIADLDLTLGLSGCSSFAELNRSNLAEASYLPSISEE